MTSQREAWAAELTELAAHDDRVLALDGDLGTSTKAADFAAARPAQFLQTGIAEQDLVGVAAGMASVGAIPWAATFGVFLTQPAAPRAPASWSSCAPATTSRSSPRACRRHARPRHSTCWQSAGSPPATGTRRS